MDLLVAFNVMLAACGVVLIAVYYKSLKKLKVAQLDVDNTLNNLLLLTKESREISDLGLEVRQMYTDVKTRVERLMEYSSRIETEVIGIRTAALLNNPKAVNARCDSILALLGDKGDG